MTISELNENRPSFEKGTRILGFDPGTRIAGYAVIESLCRFALYPRDFKLVTLGCIQASSADEKALGLGHLHNKASEIVKFYEPKYIVIEKAFVGVNIYSALRLGEARGALLSAAQRHEKGIKVFELSTAEIKKSITGNGRSEKDVVRKSLELMFGNLDKSLPFDASDALACALTLGIAANLVEKVKTSRSKSKSLKAILSDKLATISRS